MTYQDDYTDKHDVGEVVSGLRESTRSLFKAA